MLIKSSGFKIRNYEPKYFQEFLRLIVEIENLVQSGRSVSARTEAIRMKQPNFDCRRDLFLAESETGVIGYLRLNVEPEIGHALIEVLIHPERRRQGAAADLFCCAWERTKKLGLEKITAVVGETDITAAKWLESLSFQKDQRYVEMLLDPALAPALEPAPELNRNDIVIRPFRKGEEALLADVQNRSFDGHWGFNPNTPEDISFYLNLFRTRPEDIIFCLRGESPVAYCWTTGNFDEKDGLDYGTGRIHMIGVTPEFRGQGLGRVALLAGLARLEEKGASKIELTVDEQNTAAIKLYKSMGFKKAAISNWYYLTI